MKNPCNGCLVVACCTDVCQNKYDYTNKIVNKLSSIGFMIYDNKGRLKNISKIVKVRWQVWINICEKNIIEIEKINYRKIFGIYADD